MIRIPRFVAATLSLVAPVATGAPRNAPTNASAFAAREIDGRLRFLSHDLLEGRAPATSCGALKWVVANDPTGPTWNRDAEFAGLGQEFRDRCR
jgi:hypothetical protein